MITQIKLTDNKKISLDEYKLLLKENSECIVNLLIQIQEQNCYLTSFSFNENIVYYNPSTDDVLLFDNENSLFEFFNEELKNKIISPLFKYRHKLYDFENLQKLLLEDFLERLELEESSMYNFDKINLALKKYGYENLYEDLYLHLIVYCVEYLNQKSNLNGNWKFTQNHNYPLVLQPYFEDNKGVSLYFNINILLARELQNLSSEKAKLFDIETIIDFAYVYSKRKNSVKN